MVGLILLFALVIPMVTGQLIDLLRDAPSKFSALGAWVVRMESKYAVVEHLNDIVQLDSIFTAAQDIVNQALSGLLAAVRDGIVPMVNNIASTVFIVFLGFVLAFWLACDYPRINEEICRVLPEAKPTTIASWLRWSAVRWGATCARRSLTPSSRLPRLVGFTIVGHPYAGAWVFFRAC